MLDVSIAPDATGWRATQRGALNPDAVALVELLDPYEEGTRPTVVRITLTYGREIFVALQGGQITSDSDERQRRYTEFLTELQRAKSPLIGL